MSRPHPPPSMPQVADWTLSLNLTSLFPQKDYVYTGPSGVVQSDLPSPGQLTYALFFAVVLIPFVTVTSIFQAPGIRT
jgi:hypothetical protein